MQRRIPGKDETTQQHLRVWIKQYHNSEMVRQAEMLALRQDMVTLLIFVRDNKVIGTQSTGNMPLKAVRQVTARFVKPPILETTIGERVYRLRSEADIWPLYYLHILAEAGRHVAIAPARRWQLTPQGERFLETDVLFQVTVLLAIWWNQVNWIMAYPFEGMGEELPPDFSLVTLAQLRSLAVGRSISFEKFADGLIENTGLTWAAKDLSSATITMLLHGSIARMVIGILANFGGVKRKYRDEPLGKGTTPKLVGIEITPFGKAVLDAVALVSG